jgi:hypothetical protein
LVHPQAAKDQCNWRGLADTLIAKPRPNMGPMTRGDSLVIVGLFFGIIIYVLFSTLDLPKLLGGHRRLPPVLQLVHESVAAAFWRRPPSPLRVLAEYVTVLVATQLMPVIVLTQPGPRVAVRTASVIELVLALSWTILLAMTGTRAKRN